MYWELTERVVDIYHEIIEPLTTQINRCVHPEQLITLIRQKSMPDKVQCICTHGYALFSPFCDTEVYHQVIQSLDGRKTLPAFHCIFQWNQQKLELKQTINALAMYSTTATLFTLKHCSKLTISVYEFSKLCAHKCFR